MRTDLFRRSAPAGLEVDTVVVPVSDAGAAPARHVVPRVTVVPIDPARARAGVLSLFGDPVWRERLRRAEPLPMAARVASPGLADAVAAAVAATAGAGQGSHGRGAGNQQRPVALHVMRAYLAPLGLAVADRLGPVWTTLDLDDDDAALSRSTGDLESAEAYERLLSVFGSAFDGIAAASPVEASAISRRTGLHVEAMPNGVELVNREPRPPGAGRRAARSGPGAKPEVVLLFVGNLTYGPNVEAARELVERILPRAQARLGGSLRARLVGRHGAEVARLRGPSVDVTGFVEDLAPVYESADCAVVPVRRGGGTRIKVLEAFAYGLPVVASRTAAAGLAVEDGRHLLLADDPAAAAAAICRVLGEPALASGLAADAGRLLEESYSIAAVTSSIRDFFMRTASRTQPRSS